MKIFILLALVACAFGDTYIRPVLDGRIVGGSPADISDYPYQLSLEYNGVPNCGASIISTHWAVTAAHCVDGINTSNIRLRAGTSLRGIGGSVHQAILITKHSAFDSITLDFDVAVIEVREKFVFGALVQPIDLESGTVAEGTDAVTTGWGELSENGDYPDQLQSVAVPIVSATTCNKDYEGAITDRMICAGVDAGGKDTCQGDSGGPLVAGGRLIGIVSWGHGCARPHYPGVYSKVSRLAVWILSNSGP